LRVSLVQDRGHARRSPIFSIRANPFKIREDPRPKSVALSRPNI
jgi:hypothetical protein